MPTVLRLGALRVAIYPNDHRPAHVHVVGQGHEAVFELSEPGGHSALRENYGFARREIATIALALEREMAALTAAWEEIHGKA